MQQACCDGVLRSPEGLRGTTEKWETTETYVTKPDGEAKAAGKAIFSSTQQQQLIHASSNCGA